MEIYITLTIHFVKTSYK